MINHAAACCLMLVFLAPMPGFAGQEISRPDLPAFYATLATVRAAVGPRCDALEVRRLDMLLDVARPTQQQIDCDGYLFRGRKRFMELMFSDDQLDLVIVLTDPDEHEAFADTLRAQHGEPTHDSEIGLYFYDAAVALRTEPHEVVFVSKRVRAQYQLYMDSMAGEAGKPQ